MPCLCHDRLRPAHEARHPLHRSAIGPQDDCGIEDADQRFNVAGLSCREKCVDDPALGPQVGVRGRRLPWTPGGAARELARGDDRALHDRRDLLEAHPKRIVQHECQPFRRLQLLEDNEQRQTDRIGEHGVSLALRPRGRTRE